MGTVPTFGPKSQVALSTQMGMPKGGACKGLRPALSTLLVVLVLTILLPAAANLQDKLAKVKEVDPCPFRSKARQKLLIPAHAIVCLWGSLTHREARIQAPGRGLPTREAGRQLLCGANRLCAGGASSGRKPQDGESQRGVAKHARVCNRPAECSQPAETTRGNLAGGSPRAFPGGRGP